MTVSSHPTKFCHSCGAVIDMRANFCPRCGASQSIGGPSPGTFGGPPQGTFGRNTPSGRNRIAAALFAIILGGLGIHKFYLGQIGPGIVYLLFCWTFIPSLIGFIEGIVYLTMTDMDFAEKYG